MSYGRTFTWRQGFWLLFAIIIVQFFFTHTLPATRGPASPLSPVSNINLGSATKDKDARTWKPPEAIKIDLHGEISQELSSEQCDQIFPKLYQDVERATAYWKERGHVINANDLDVSWRSKLQWPFEGGALRILIHENELRVVESRTVFANPGYRPRAISFLSLLNQAILDATLNGEKLPTIEAAIVLQDIGDFPTQDGTHSFWTWTSNLTDPSHDRHWLIPNFDFYAAGELGSYRQARKRARDRVSSWTSKVPKIVWRGTVFYNVFIRQGLVEAAKGKLWSDVVPLNPETKVEYITVDEMCKYAMTAHTEGASYSGRLKFLLNCDSLPLIHELGWKTFYTHLLERDGPNQNYVAVQRDYGDLGEKVEHYLANPGEAETVVRNSLSTFRDRYITPAAVSCYLRKLIVGYSTVAETPQIYRPSMDITQIPSRRGKGFEEWLQGTEDYLEEDV